MLSVLDSYDFEDLFNIIVVCVYKALQTKTVQNSN